MNAGREPTPGTGAARAVSAAHTVSAAAEQRWNEAALAAPVQRRAWRLWAYREPAVVLGRAQQGLIAEIGHRRGPALLVRAAGGGAVLVGPWMLGLSALLPAADALAVGGVVASYRWLGQTLATALRCCGVDARALAPEALRAHRGPTAAAPDWACFGGLAPWEVLVGERKIAGLAQVRRRQGVLLVAGVLLRPPPWALLCERLGRPPEEAQRLAGATTTLAEAVGAGAAPPASEALVVALAHGLQVALNAASPSPVPARR